MTSTRTLLRSFAGGEISPEMSGRIDLTGYQTGLAKCLNFIPLPQGSVQNRPGTEFVGEVKDSSRRVRLIPFSFSPTQTMVLEFGHFYLRFHTMGGTVLSGGVPYEIATPYLDTDLFDLHYVQSADVLTVVHPNYDPREIRRLGATNWTISVISFTPTIAGAGAAVTATAVDPNFPPRLPEPFYVVVTDAEAGANNVAYKVTAIGNDPRQESTPASAFSGPFDIQKNIRLLWGSSGGAVGYRVYRDDTGTGSGVYGLLGETTGLTFDDLKSTSNHNIQPGGPSSPTPGSTTEFYVVTLVSASGEESVQSNVVSVTNDLTLLGATNDIAETAPQAHVYFNVYKRRSGIYGFIGTAPQGSVFHDDNIEPDLSRTPPTLSDPFATANNDPGAVTYFEQRRLFAGTNINPQTVWGTKSGTESNLSGHIPTRSDDAISFRIAAREVNTIRHLVPLNDVLILTNSAEWKLASADGGGLTPENISVRPQSYIGASNVQPVVTNTSILYVQARGSHVREIVYTLGNAGASYNNADISIMATHLFDFKTIVDIAYSKSPQQVMWAVSSDGGLLSLSYVPDQKVAGWARPTTAASGMFESCAVVSEGNEDALYVVVRRTIQGGQLRYVERLHSRSFTALEDAFFVDCGDTYSGAATTTISGLGHLEGQTVSILGNGATMTPKVVTGGAITLERAVTKAQIGLPITAEIRTMPMAIEQLAAMGQGSVKNINKVYMRVVKTSGIKAGPTSALLKEAKQRINEPYDSPPNMMGDPDAEDVEIVVTPNWENGGQVVVRQDYPLPVTVTALVLDVAIGG